MSEPMQFIDGDFFESLCSHSYYKDDWSTLKPGDLLYINSDDVPALFERVKASGLRNEFRLLSHNGDATIRRSQAGHFVFHQGLGINPRSREIEVPDLVLQWFGQNLEAPNEGRFFSLPIGLERRRWSQGLKHQILEKLIVMPVKPEALLYVNHAGNTNPDRCGLSEQFMPHPWCRVSGKVSFLDYCIGMMRSQFVLSPDGNGLDCHRSWEALYLGRIPVIKRTRFHEAVYRGLPVVFVESFLEITEAFLIERASTLQTQTFDLRRLGQAYYRELVRAPQAV